MSDPITSDDPPEVVIITAPAVDAPASGSSLIGEILGWQNLLQPASFRGVPFAVLDNERRIGRRIALHEYPFRDDPWPEDVGRKTGRIAVTGFLLDNDVMLGTGPLSAARQAIENAATQSGTGIFVHPARGPMTVACEELSIVERWEDGACLELRFTFIEGAQTRQFPSVGNGLESLLSGAADSLDDALGFDFTGDMASALKYGQDVVNQVTKTTNQFVQFTRGISADATNLQGALTSLPGNFGRYFGRGTSGFLKNSPANPLATVSSLEAATAAARANVTSAASALTSAAGLL